MKVRNYNLIKVLALAIILVPAIAANGQNSKLSRTAKSKAAKKEITALTPMEQLKQFAVNIYEFNQIFPQETVFLQFDNTSYYTGETIWFKAYVVSAPNLHRPESQVLYVDLVSPQGWVLKTQKLKVVAGQADGSFPLLDAATEQARQMRGVTGYPSGFYEVRAYTANMLNFGEEVIFSRVIPVFEEPSKEGQYYSESPKLTIKSLTSSDPRPKQKKEDKLSVSFYPEGGHLIIGKTQKVAFKATNQNGLGTHATGTINGKEVSTIHNGMGFFEFTPQSKNNSVTMTDASGNRQTFRLPDAETSGCTMTIGQGNEDILVRTSATADLAGTNAGITVTCRGSLLCFETMELSESDQTIALPSSEFPEGVCRITVFTQTGSILCSRSFYHRKDGAGPLLDVVASDRLTPFGKVGLEFTLRDGKGVPFRDRFCLSVRDSRGSRTNYADDLRTSLLLSSDLKGFIEGPDYYFESHDAEHTQALDLLTLIQGWERYDWQTMAGITPFEEKHRIEEGLTINGWILDPVSREPMAGAMVLAAVMPKDKKLTDRFRFTTGKDGYFGFDMKDFYDVATMTLNIRSERKRIGTKARIMLERSIQPSARPYLTVETTLAGNTAQKKKGRIQETANVTAEEEDFPAIIDIDRGYVLEEVEIEGSRKYIDFFRFNAYDVPKDVELELDKGDFSTDVLGYLLDKGYQVYADDSTESTYVDGHLVFWYVHNSKRLLNTGIWEEPLTIDTKDIKSLLVYEKVMSRLDAISLAPLYTEYLQHTVSSIYSGEGNEDSLYQNVLMIDLLVKEDYELSSKKELLDIAKRITTLEGFSSPYQFYSPTYPDGPIPGDVDYRRTLYWNPNVITDENGKAQVEFYGNSHSTRFTVTGTGLTAGGVPYVLDRNF